MSMRSASSSGFGSGSDPGWRRTRSTPLRVRRVLFQRVAAWVVATALLAGLSCATSRIGPPAADPVPDEGVQAASIRVGDLLEIRVLNHPELGARRAHVDPRGMIEVPKLVAIRAEGLGPGELRRVIQRRFREYKAHRHVIVLVRRLAGG